MKNFRSIKSIGLISCVVLLASCQNEGVNIPEQEALPTTTVQLIDPTYIEDLESYTDIPVVFEDGQYTIEEVLTDTSLFNRYQNAQTHYYAEINDDTTLYVTPEDEDAAAKMIAEITGETNDSDTRSAKRTTASNKIDYKVTLYNSKNQKGSTFVYEKIQKLETLTRKGSSDNKTYKKNVDSRRRNQANSMRIRDKSSTNVKVDLSLYTGTNQSGKSKQYKGPESVWNSRFDDDEPNSTFKYSEFREIDDFSKTNLKNDAIASLKIKAYWYSKTQ